MPRTSAGVLLLPLLWRELFRFSTTIDLKLGEEYKVQLSTPAPSLTIQLRNAAVNGFRNAFGSLLGMVLFVSESGPTLLLWLSIREVPAWMLWRRNRRAQPPGAFAGV